MDTALASQRSPSGKKRQRDSGSTRRKRKRELEVRLEREGRVEKKKRGSSHSHTSNNNARKRRRKQMERSQSATEKVDDTDKCARFLKDEGNSGKKVKKKKSGGKKQQGKKKKGLLKKAVPTCVAYESLASRIQPDDGGNVALARIDHTLTDVPKNEIRNLPLYDRQMRIVVVANAKSSNAAVSEIYRELENNSESEFRLLGFDTETKPKFHKGGEGNRVALVQLATESTAYLFRLCGKNNTVMTQSLRSLLADPTVVKVGVGIHQDVKELDQCHGRGTCGDGSSYLDLASLAQLRWPNLKRPGLRNLTATVLGSSLSKAQQMANWERPVLTPKMEKYAAADATVALDLLAAIIGSQ